MLLHTATVAETLTSRRHIYSAWCRSAGIPVEKILYQHGQSITITVGVGGGCTNGALDTCPRNRPGLRSRLKLPMARVRCADPATNRPGKHHRLRVRCPRHAGCP